MNRYKLQEDKIPINRWPTVGQTWANKADPKIRIKLESKQGSRDETESKDVVVWKISGVKWDHLYLTESNLLGNWTQVYEPIQVQQS